jgi:hypothetical protein
VSVAVFDVGLTLPPFALKVTVYPFAVVLVLLIAAAIVKFVPYVLVCALGVDVPPLAAYEIV